MPISAVAFRFFLLPPLLFPALISSRIQLERLEVLVSNETTFWLPYNKLPSPKCYSLYLGCSFVSTAIALYVVKLAATSRRIKFIHNFHNMYKSKAT